MKKLYSLLLLSGMASAQALPPPSAAPRSLPPLPPGMGMIQSDPESSKPYDLSTPPSQIELNGVSISKVVELYYKNNSRPYRLGPEIQADQNLVSFRFVGDVERSFKGLLYSYGYVIRNDFGVDVITKILVEEVGFEPFLYQVKNLDPSALSRLLEGFFPSGRFSLLGGVQTGTPVPQDRPIGANSAAANGVLGSDVWLTYMGPPETIPKLKKILEQVDIAPQMVEIHAVLFEVSESSVKSMGLSIFGDNGIVGVNSGNAAPNPTFSLSYGGFTLALNAIKTNGNFKVISTPFLLAQNGKTSMLNVGSEIPVLGAVTYQNGTPVQSVEYRPSGSLFEITPRIYADSIQLNIRQELSEYVETTTSTVPSPTKLTRQIETDITVKPNTGILLGGMGTDKISSSKGGFFIFKNKNHTMTKSNLVLLIFVGDKK